MQLCINWFISASKIRLSRKPRNLVKLLSKCLHLPKAVSMFASEIGNDPYLGYPELLPLLIHLQPFNHSNLDYPSLSYGKPFFYNQQVMSAKFTIYLIVLIASAPFANAAVLDVSHSSKEDGNKYTYIINKQLFSNSVDIQFFEVSLYGNSVLLTWKANNETSIHHFEVERSEDKSVAKTVGLVLDGMEEQGAKSYLFKESMQRNTKNHYYRVKAIHYDGTITYGEWKRMEGLNARKYRKFRFADMCSLKEGHQCRLSTHSSISNGSRFATSIDVQS